MPVPPWYPYRVAMPDSVVADPGESFIARWREAQQAERANYVSFLDELCGVLGVARPTPAQGGLGDYRYERAVTHRAADGSTSTLRIDLYKRDCFVLEAKQGALVPRQTTLFAADEGTRRSLIRGSPGWAKYMMQARGQAEGYARDVPGSEGRVPFLVVCDVGFCSIFMPISAVAVAELILAKETCMVACESPGSRCHVDQG